MAVLPNDRSEIRLLLTGGGTGGHVYPSVAVAHCLERRLPRLGCQWVGSERMESQLLPKLGIDFRRIDIRFSYRPLNRTNIGYYINHILPIFYGRPFRQAHHVVESFRPHFVLGTGGYVSAPAIYAAQRLGIPYALIQLDSPPGAVNWFFADRAWRVYAATPRVASGFTGRCSMEKVNICGYPTLPPARTVAKVYDELGINRRKKILLVMGGSMGAAAIDRQVYELLEYAMATRDSRMRDLVVVHVTGRRPGEVDKPEGKLADGPVDYISAEYLEDMPGVMAAASFYLGRSGAATTGELIAASLPSLLVPDPQHADNQQFYNADELVNAGLGTVVSQGQATGKSAYDWLVGNWDRPRPAATAAIPAEEIADDIVRALEAE